MKQVCALPSPLSYYYGCRRTIVVCQQQYVRDWGWFGCDALKIYLNFAEKKFSILNSQFSTELTPRMKLRNHLPQIIAVKVGVNLSGDDRLVAEHFLHGPQTGPALDQVRGERVPEGVRTDVLGNPRCFGDGFDD